ncbi:MAG: hypothetical protein Q9160_002566 [Pyrenula sp. 1 TL-2023]
MAAPMTSAPVLSTPETYILNDVDLPTKTQSAAAISDEEFVVRYEIQRTLSVIRSRKWKRVALQFPDEMLPDAPRVYRLLRNRLEKISSTDDIGRPRNDVELSPKSDQKENDVQKATSAIENLSLASKEDTLPPKLYILADTSYGSCCVDEIAAEHVNADSIVHYGRACLSPTARLPVLHIFTKNILNLDPVIGTFKATFPDKNEKVVLAADMLYEDHVQSLHWRLRDQEGYHSLISTELIHDPSAPIPNRKLPSNLPSPLKDHSLFHLSTPPTSLLLTLSSRLKAMYIYPTLAPPPASSSPSPLPPSTTSPLLRRRYALLTTLRPTLVWGILIATLSVQHYASLAAHLRSRISRAGKTSYTFVMGKLNAAKLANFAEVGAWVVVGCWESSLVDGRELGGLWRPVVTPWECVGVLEGGEGRGGEDGMGIAGRLWEGEWKGDWVELMGRFAREEEAEEDQDGDGDDGDTDEQLDNSDEEDEDEEDEEDEGESAPPIFDLRTGRYVSDPNPKPKRQTKRLPKNNTSSSTALLKPSKENSLTKIRGTPSAGAEFLRENRTWKGLGSDFHQGVEIGYEEEDGGGGGERDGRRGEGGGLVREGRTGVARGYVVGDGDGEGEGRR